MTDFANLLDAEPYDPAASGKSAAPDLAESTPQDPDRLANQGIYFRDHGEPDRAEAIFQDLIRRFPHLVFGWQELAILRSMMGRHQEALDLRRRAVEAAPSDLLARKNLAFQLLGHGEPDQALQVLGAHPVSEQRAAAAVRALSQFVRFVSEHSCASGLALIDRFEKSERYLIGEALASRVVTAIQAAEPFSLIRLGDGEGAWLRIDDKDNSRFADLYEVNRRAILQIWFGSDKLRSSPYFAMLGERLSSIIRRTDVVGLPSGLRLINEYRNQSIRSIPPCINILRSLLGHLGSENRTLYCAQDAHLDLHLNGFWGKLLKMPVTFGLITCHPGLAYRLAVGFGSHVARAIVIPEEKGFSQIAGISSMTEAHYPRVFIRTLARLEREGRQAQVWLVAAGFLGKFYCDTLRNAGSVALDVGSIVDGWSGCVTRPTMTDIQRFRL